MKSKLFFRSAFVVLCGLAVPPVCQVTAAAENTVTEQGIGHAMLSLARADLGTQIQVHDPAGSKIDARMLIGDDASRDYTLSAGTTSFVLSLSKIEVLNHFSFSDAGAEGKVTISVSNTKLAYNAPGWKEVGKEEHFDGSRSVECNFGSAEGRYVKVDFTTTKSGRIAGFGLFGTPVASTPITHLGYVTTPTRTEVAAQSQDRTSFYDYASLTMGAKVVAVSHADNLADAQYMIDGSDATAFTFDAADPNPTAVVDLGIRRKVERVTCAFEAPAGQLDFYLVENAYTKDDAQSVSLNYVTAPGVMPVANVETLNYNADQLLANRKPVGSVTISGAAGINHVSVNLVGLEGRFLVAAFHRSGEARHRSGDYKDRDFKDTDAKDFKDAPVAGIADNPVKVEGISAFGEPPGSQAIPLLPPSGTKAVSP